MHIIRSNDFEVSLKKYVYMREIFTIGEGLIPVS